MSHIFSNCYRLRKSFGRSWSSDFELTGRYIVASSAKNQDQDQDSLLVKRRNDNYSPGYVIREISP